MPNHRLHIMYDESTGELSITHRCTSELAGHNIRWSETVELAEPEHLTTVLKTMIDANRVEVEKRAAVVAVQHVAAVTGRATRNNKQIQLGGTMGPTGETAP